MRTQSWNHGKTAKSLRCGPNSAVWKWLAQWWCDVCTIFHGNVMVIVHKYKCLWFVCRILMVFSGYVQSVVFARLGVTRVPTLTTVMTRTAIQMRKPLQRYIIFTRG